jgi:hypothetical protein
MRNRTIAIAALSLVAWGCGGEPSRNPAGSSPVAGTTPSWADCLARSEGTTEVIAGLHSDYRNDEPPADWNLDLSAAEFDGYPDVTNNVVRVGRDVPLSWACIGGGVVVGQQPRDLTWNEMHDDIGGGGYRIDTRAGQWVRVDGIRVDNVEDAFLPRGRDGRWELHNAYMTYIRDDCIENDETAPGSVHDSLFDGCYTGFSEQWQHECCDATSGEVFVVDRVLMRLEAMPGPYNTHDPNEMGHGRWFKWMTPVPHPVEINDSIFMTEQRPGSDGPFPFLTTTKNVTIVWLGAEEWDWPVPEGTTVTIDITVWEEARARWLERHGCDDFHNCTKLLNPDPWP